MVQNNLDHNLTGKICRILNAQPRPANSGVRIPALIALTLCEGADGMSRTQASVYDCKHNTLSRTAILLYYFVVLVVFNIFTLFKLFHVSVSPTKAVCSTITSVHGEE